ncbi:hypothetical protein R3P38DRAFT_3235680 [Favolaschia claudopus]|uniref:Uncharacterized protein n=1 Tax=Favolaschia claudopus TaxID=2862362 RepID=A0AAV9ZDZ7_9AGAR
MSDRYSLFVNSIARLGQDPEKVRQRLESCGEMRLFHVARQSSFLFQIVSAVMVGRMITTKCEEYGAYTTQTPTRLPAELKLNIAKHLDIRSLRFVADAYEVFRPECTRMIGLLISDVFRAGMITGDFLYDLLLCSGAEHSVDNSGSLFILVDLEETVAMVASFLSASSDYVVNPTDEPDCESVVTMSRPYDKFKIEIRACLCPEAWVMKQRYTNLFNWLTATELFVGYHKLTFTGRGLAGGGLEGNSVRCGKKTRVKIVEYDSHPSNLTCPSIERSSLDESCLTIALPTGWTSSEGRDRSAVYWRLGSCSHRESSGHYIQVVDT